MHSLPIHIEHIFSNLIRSKSKNLILRSVLVFGHILVSILVSPGLAVKNLRAFHLLQASLMHSENSLLACQLLRTLQTIWERDPANFFLLEWTVQSVAQLATCVWRKPAPVQKLFFSLVEMV